MKYKVYCDSYPLLLFENEDYRIFAPKLSQEDNKAGSFQFTIYPTHPNYSRIERLKSTIRIFCGGEVIFKGRVLSDQTDFNNAKTVFCEGWLAILNDSIQRPFQFPVDDNATTPADYFEFLISRHNAQMPPEKQLIVGNVTVTDDNNYIARSDSEYSTTWELLKDGLLDSVGGHLVLRFEGDQTYIDYLSDFTNLSSQPIVFGENLLKILTTRKSEDIATAILPLGAQNEETGERLTISSLEDSTTDDVCKDGDLVYSIAAETAYNGRIVKVVTWDDVTVPLNLLRKARAELTIRRAVVSEQKLTAADMSAAGYDVEPWMVGKYVYVTDAAHQDAHELQPYYLIKSVSINLIEPSQNTVSVGAVASSFSENSQTQLKKAVGDLTIIVDRHIDNRLEGIDADLSRLESEIQITNESVTNVYQYAQNANSRVNDIEAYIKTGHILDDSNGDPIFGVLIGQQDLTGSFRSAFTSQMLGFYEGEDLVAFFSNSKLNVETIRTAALELTDDLSDPNATDWIITLTNGFTLKWIGS